MFSTRLAILLLLGLQYSSAVDLCMGGFQTDMCVKVPDEFDKRIMINMHLFASNVTPGAPIMSPEETVIQVALVKGARGEALSTFLAGQARQVKGPLQLEAPQIRSLRDAVLVSGVWPAGSDTRSVVHLLVTQCGEQWQVSAQSAEGQSERLKKLILDVAPSISFSHPRCKKPAP